MRIAVVNDLPMAVEVLRRAVLLGGHQVAWVALDGAEAVEKSEADPPDLILMDLLMPVMDGVQATASIMRRSPCAILIVTASVSGNAAKVFDAMGCGALDVVRTPVLGPAGDMAGAQALLDKIAMIGKLIEKEAPVPAAEVGSPRRSAAMPALVALGSSTGGPKALATILAGLPQSLEAGIAIVQHLDVHFAGELAGWLNEQTELTVVLAQEGMRVEPGTAFLAATNDHLVLAEDLAFRYTREPWDYPYRPSADTFFRSLRDHCPRPGIAVLLTGMGKDGAQGLLLLREAGWHTIAQDAKTSVVYGMPKAAAQIGAAMEVLRLDEIAPAILGGLEKEKTDRATK